MSSLQAPNLSLATWLYAIHRSLVEQGLDADAVLAGAGLDFAQLKSTTQRVPKYLVDEAWRAAERATGNDAFCISIFSHVNDPNLNAIITIVQASSSVEHAIQLLLRYYKVVATSSKLHFETNQEAELHVTGLAPGVPVSRHDVDLIFGLISKYGSVLPAKEIRPSIIYFERSEPTNAKAYEDYFECPLIFGADKNVLQFPTALLKASVPSANPMLSMHVEKYLSAQVENDAKDGFANAVEQALVELLPNGTPRLKDVAQRLNMSERTLQRKLHQHDVSFKEILKEVRVALAHRYLSQADTPIQSIAYQLGFTEPGNFIRFFKQHTGQTPLAYIKSMSV